MASGIYLNESVWSSPLVGYNKTQTKCHGPKFEETWPDHAIRSSVATTKLPLGLDILKKKKKNKFDFLKKKNSPDFF